MKILSVIVGLVLTAGGVYLAYDTFMLFDDLETLRLGLLLGGSFLAMTFGLYFFLLPLAMKPKSKRNIVKEVIVEAEPSEAFISETEALHVIQENDVKQETSQDDHLNTFENLEVKLDSVEKDSLDLDKTKAYEVIHETLDTQARHADFDQTRIMTTLFDEGPHDVDGDTIVLPTFNEEVEEEAGQTDDRLFTAKVFNDTFDFETKHELRVIGIESFGSQRILRKLKPESELKLSYKQKKGLNLAQVTHHDKVIGYVSRLEMNHLNKSLDQLIRVTPGDIVTDGRKVIRFSIQLHFKDEEKQNA